MRAEPGSDTQITPETHPKCRLPDVADAVGGVGGLAHLIVNGKVVHFGGAPNLGFSVDPTRPELNTLRDGRERARNAT